jgi:hypothetical protein
MLSDVSMVSTTANGRSSSVMFSTLTTLPSASSSPRISTSAGESGPTGCPNESQNIRRDDDLWQVGRVHTGDLKRGGWALRLGREHDGG